MKHKKIYAYRRGGTMYRPKMQMDISKDLGKLQGSYWLINRVLPLISGPRFKSKIECWEEIYSPEQTNFSYASISANIPTANALH